MPSSANPAMDSTTVSNGLEIKKKIDVCRDLILGIEGGKSGLAERLHDRLCSHFGPVHWFRTVVITLLLVSFVSHLLLHVQLGQVREESREQQDKIEDLVEASRLILNADSGQQPSLKTTSKLDTDEKLQRSRTLRRARRKRNVPASPNFFFRGRPGVNPSTNTGVFLWETTPDNPMDAGSFELTETDDGSVERVTIKTPGVYYVFAKIAVHGRRPPDGELEQSAVYPPMGAMLRRRNLGGQEEVLDASYSTQDDRGAEYGYGLDDYPLDSVEVRGLYFLQYGEKIWVSKPTNLENNPNGEMYHSEQTATHFGAFMVEEAKIW